MTDTPAVPLTLEGSSALHQMFRFDWKRWRELPATERASIAQSATMTLQDLEQQQGSDPAIIQTAVYSQLGHKGDLLLLHFRESMEALNAVEHTLARERFHDFLIPVFSYVSVVELGLYESSPRTYASLAADGIKPHTDEWNQSIKEMMDRQAKAMAPRLYPSIPEAKYLCFYPMDRKRGEQINWYTVPMEDRQRMTRDHGMIGRRYAGKVRQIITGSMGLDDWEWGVDLFGEDPVIFKELIYEMRFDETSALYALFGPFQLGVRLPVTNLKQWLELPA